MPTPEDLTRRHPVRDASPATLERLLDRLRRSGEAEAEVRRRELEDFLAELEDAIITAYERGQDFEALMNASESVLMALERWAEGRREPALALLEQALRTLRRHWPPRAGQRRPPRR